MGIIEYQVQIYMEIPMEKKAVIPLYVYVTHVIDSKYF